MYGTVSYIPLIMMGTTTRGSSQEKRTHWNAVTQGRVIDPAQEVIADGISDYTDVRQILTDIRKSKEPKQVTIRNSRVSLEAAPKST